MSLLITTFSAAFNKCVAVWYAVVISFCSASPPLNFCSLPILDFSWCSLNNLSNSVKSILNPCSPARSAVISGGNPYVSYSLNIVCPSIIFLFSCFALCAALLNSFSPWASVFMNLSFSSIITCFIVSLFFSKSGYISFNISMLRSINPASSFKSICNLFKCLDILLISFLKT